MSRFSDLQVNLIHHAQQLMQQPAARRSASFAGTSIGFTIVELLIVIVVIGILAAIVIVAYNGITTSANRAMVASEAKQWAKLFEIYKIQNNGSLPNLSNGSYCLGTGFPNGYCSEGNSTNGVAENTGAPIITALSTVGNPPLNSKKWVMQGGARVGPWVQVTSSEFRINTFITADSTDECTKLGVSDSSWISANGHDVICRIHIPKT